MVGTPPDIQHQINRLDYQIKKVTRPTVFLVLILLIGVIFFPFDDDKYEGDEIYDESQNQEGTDQYVLDSCGSNMTFFNHPPADIENITYLSPLGNLNPPGHTFPTDHLYFYLDDPNESNYSDSVDVFATGDGYITDITRQHIVSQNRTDYGLTIKPCEEFKITYGHVLNLSEKLLDAIADVDEENQWCDEPYSIGGGTYETCGYWGLKIEVKSGEVIGISSTTAALDIGAADYREVQNHFINQERVESSDVPYLVCAIDYFEEEMKNALEEIITRTEEPVCGDFVQEMEGTALGRWYLEGIEDIYTDECCLALVNDNDDPSLGAISVGTSMPELNNQPKLFQIESTGFINRNFSNITPDGNTYCIDIIHQNPSYANGIFLVYMETDERIRVEFQSDFDCIDNWNFTDDSIIFVR